MCLVLKPIEQTLHFLRSIQPIRKLLNRFTFDVREHIFNLKASMPSGLKQEKEKMKKSYLTLRNCSYSMYQYGTYVRSLFICQNTNPISDTSHLNFTYQLLLDKNCRQISSANITEKNMGVNDTELLLLNVLLLSTPNCREILHIDT